MKHTWHYAKKAGWLIAAALLLKLAAAYLELQIPSALADIIDDGVSTRSCTTARSWRSSQSRRF